MEVPGWYAPPGPVRQDDGMDLAEFLRARLDEDEQTARWAAEEVGDGRWQQRNVRIVTVADDDREVADFAIVECIDHITRHDPARVLAEVEADRKLIAEYERAVEWFDRPENRHHSAGEVTGLYTAVKIRAERFAAHPDYRQEWKP